MASKTKTDETVAVGGELPVDAVDPTPEPLHDRVVMATRDPDGNPIGHNVEFIGPKDEVEHAAKVQLAQQAVTRVDEGIHKARQVDEQPGQANNPVVDRIRAAQDAEVEKAERQAETEVAKLHRDA